MILGMRTFVQFVAAVVGKLLLEDNTSFLLMEDGSSHILAES